MGDTINERYFNMGQSCPFQSCYFDLYHFEGGCRPHFFCNVSGFIFSLKYHKSCIRKKKIHCFISNRCQEMGCWNWRIIRGSSFFNQPWHALGVISQKLLGIQNEYLTFFLFNVCPTHTKKIMKIWDGRPGTFLKICLFDTEWPSHISILY